MSAFPGLDRDLGVQGREILRIAHERGPVGWRSAPRLPPEIAFLSGHGIGPRILLEATELAAREGVSADVALLHHGLLSEEEFYRCLASHVGIPYLEHTVRVEVGPDPTTVIASGIAMLMPNDAGHVFLIAPRGTQLADLSNSRRQRSRSERRRVAIAAPRYFAALVRSAHRGLIVRQACHGLRKRDAWLSSRHGLVPAQTGGILGTSFLTGAGLECDAYRTCVGASLICGFVFLLAATARLYAMAASLPPSSAWTRHRVPDHALPIYTVLVPLYREARVLPKILAALDALDYPATKLDIKFIVEADDGETIAAFATLRLPARYEVIVAPRGSPRTKPRALNVALPYAQGGLLVVYDAEDEPDPGQLRLAAARFARASASLACLQARLAIDNTDDGWLPRLFTIEYAALFDVINPGLARLALPMLLGGSSNHFRTAALRQAGGWDAYNVTEDADLGIRLARNGFAVETLDSTTFEEAPSRLYAWLGQRRRWMKGWMVTLVVHTRQPRRLARELGLVRASTTLFLMMGTVLGALLGPMFTLGALVAAVSGRLWHGQSAGDLAAIGLSGAVLLTGTASAIGASLMGLRRRGWRLASALLLLPLYLGLMSMAAWAALIECGFDPYSWAKTEHGLARHSRRRGIRRYGRAWFQRLGRSLLKTIADEWGRLGRRMASFSSRVASRHGRYRFSPVQRISRIPAIAERLEAQAQRVHEQQAPDEPGAEADDLAQHLEGHHGADDSGQSAEDADFGTRRNAPGRRRLGEKTAIGRIARSVRAELERP
jgi:cellulose synthase/poly-beta-1,6-N-acetylglucosamine synthase-like glycosyltransferase